MAAPDLSRPPAYDVLLATGNLAADDALVQALGEMESPYQALALGVLVERHEEEALARIVARFNAYPDDLRQLMLRRADALAAGVRRCVGDDDLAVRSAAVDLIRASGSGRLAYLLGDVLAQPCRRTAELAAQALRSLIEGHERRPPRYASSHRPTPRTEMDYLVAAVGRGLASWAVHFRPDVPAAAARLAEHLEDTIIRLADEGRTKVRRAFDGLPDGVRDPGLVAYYVRALGSAQLRESAVRVFAAPHEDRWLLALCKEAWLLADPVLRKALVRVRAIGGWTDAEAGNLPGFHEHPRAAMRLLVATGLSGVRKAACLRRVALGADAGAQRAAAWALIENRLEGGDEALYAVARHVDGPLACIAHIELRRRRGLPLNPGTDPIEPVNPLAAAGEAAWSAESAFDVFWDGFDTLTAQARREIGGAVARDAPGFTRRLQAKLAGESAADRLRALSIAAATATTTALAEDVYAAAHDPDPTVRSKAVALLGELPNAISRRLLTAALDDPDERVQANALEALEALGWTGVAGRLSTKLDSPSSRVRANAIKALLHLSVREGAHRLLAMLASAESGDRLSALWVVERLRLVSVVRHLGRIASADPDERVRRRAQRVWTVLRSQVVRLDGRSAAPTEVHP